MRDKYSKELIRKGISTISKLKKEKVNVKIEKKSSGKCAFKYAI